MPRSSAPMLSPASPRSRSLRNISTPVQIDLRVSRMPTISTSSPTLITPRSTRPVTTVPRPEIENTSSMGIRKGWSTARTGVGMYSSTAAISARIESSPIALRLADHRLVRRALDDRDVVAGELVGASAARAAPSPRARSSSSSSTRSILFMYTTMRGHPHLARQKDVLARLRHRPVGGRADQDRPVHLRRARDHVLHVVGVPGAVDMRVVPVRRLVLHMRRRDRDPPRPLLRRRVDLVVGLEVPEILA